MTKTLEPVATTNELPSATNIVIIGGGIIGVTAALALAERNIPVVLLEKGQIAAEQSSRNLGWIRKTSRHAQDIPLAQAADRLWAQMPERIGHPVGYRQTGILFVARSPEQMAMHEAWHRSVDSLELDSRLLSPTDIERLVPGGQDQWQGGVYTPSDGRAEPALATSAMAGAAIRKGATIVQECAVRTLSRSAGKVSGVVTEKGEIRCDQVLLAGGAWSRRFLKNLGVSLPTLPLICSVLRTRPMEGPTDIAVGAPDFSFRKHQDGGFVITQRGKLDAPITLDHLQVGWRYLNQLRTQHSFLNVRLGRHFMNDLALGRRWKHADTSPFERVRVMDPEPNTGLNEDALRNLASAWPQFAQATVDEAWAGLIDVTPDSLPVIDQVNAIPGLTVATGFSGHGFGTGPAAGQLAADLLANTDPIINPAPYRFNRF
ncbi:NAD(P)/FAD-dependent oxidoreductase [Marinobacter oulmenensis]|uniref:Glycine/D-amino acid oxidase-like deaminating enzyme n=1 Tax=Marinobacter oulmenensis TaxID=643747 RepID=A0A840ULI4_9GAMM|nr:FAD-binding oxidoreductase [Marinobacter oulmenensis]MBB5321946.1 glycine/D-amino acid oxidase-like deaminating enzyme [Marinobacter oulmenensis]